MRILVHSPINLSVRVWSCLRPIPVLRSVKKDRNGVPVVKKGPERRSGAFRSQTKPDFEYCRSIDAARPGVEIGC